MDKNDNEDLTLPKVYRDRLEILVEECQQGQAEKLGIKIEELRTVPGCVSPAECSDAALLTAAFLHRAGDTIAAMGLNDGDPRAPRIIAGIAGAIAAQIERVEKALGEDAESMVETLRAAGARL